MAAKELVVSFEINGTPKGNKGNGSRSMKAYTTTKGNVYGEIHDFGTAGAATSSPNGVQNI